MPKATDLLRQDHKKVQKLFKQFERTPAGPARKSIVDEVITELEIHMAVEEEIFYPAVRKAIEKGVPEVAEARVEHSVAQRLISDLKEMRANAALYEATFTVLAENITHHVDEEEKEMFPEVERTDLDLERLGAKMQQRKEQLLDAGGVSAGAAMTSGT